MDFPYLSRQAVPCKERQGGSALLHLASKRLETTHLGLLGHLCDSV